MLTQQVDNCEKPYQKATSTTSSFFHLLIIYLFIVNTRDRFGPRSPRACRLVYGVSLRARAYFALNIYESSVTLSEACGGACGSSSTYVKSSELLYYYFPRFRVDEYFLLLLINIIICIYYLSIYTGKV